MAEELAEFIYGQVAVCFVLGRFCINNLSGSHRAAEEAVEPRLWTRTVERAGKGESGTGHQGDWYTAHK